MKWTDWIVPVLITLVAWVAMGLAFTVGRVVGTVDTIYSYEVKKVEKK